jgi:sirohydrochlorin cobaltochelatase
MAILRAKRRYPEVTFQYKRAVEVEEKVLQIMKQRLSPFQEKIGEETAILLVGRGSSDREANSDLFKVARLLWEEIPARWVEVAFMGVTKPLFHEGMERCIKLGAKTIIVLPYFLFTGILIKRMQRFTNDWKENDPERSIEQAPYLGIDDELFSVFLSRLDEDVSKRWTWESLSRQAMKQRVDHHHHHHHHQ